MGNDMEKGPAAKVTSIDRQRLYDVLETLPAMVGLLTPDYRVPFVNKAFRDKLGEPLGRRCHEYRFGRGKPCERCKTHRVFKSGKPHRWQVTTADGSCIIDVHAFPFTDTDGSPLVIEMGIDVTEQKRTEKALSEKEKQVRSLSASLINAQECERRRISKELHDELGQALAIAKLRLGIIENWLDKDQQAAREACAGLSDYLDHVIEDVRRLSHRLSPAVLEDLGLTAALKWLVGGYQITKIPNVTAGIADVDRLIPQYNWITAYRVMQEALTNVMKHSGAKNVSVVVQPADGMVDFQIEDDGKGFDQKKTAKASAQKGLGLSTMSERVEMIGGNFEVLSSIGGGTRVSFSLPSGETGA